MALKMAKKRNKILDEYADTTTRELMVEVLNKFAQSRDKSFEREIYREVGEVKTSIKSVDDKLVKFIECSEKKDADQYDKINANTNGIIELKGNPQGNGNLSKLKLSGIITGVTILVTSLFEFLKFIIEIIVKKEGH